MPPTPAGARAARRRDARRRACAARRAIVRPDARRLGRRAQVPAAGGRRVRAAALPRDGRRAPAGDGDQHARRDDARRHLRPARRRLPPLRDRRACGWCRTSRRCSTTTRSSRGSTCTRWQVTGDDAYRRVVTETLDYVAREMLDPAAGSTRRRTRTPRARRAASSSGRPTRSRGGRPSSARTPTGDAELFMRGVRRAPSGQLRGQATSCSSRGPRPRSRDDRGMDAARGRGASRARPRGAARGREHAREARPRRQGARRAGTASCSPRSPRPRGCSVATTTWPSPRRTPSSCSPQMRDRGRPDAANVEGRARQAQRLPRGLRALSPTGCWSSTRPPSSRAGSSRARAGRLDRRSTSPTPAAGSSTRATTTRRCSCGPRACRTARCPRVGRWRRACCCGSPQFTGEGGYADAAEGALAAQQPLMARAPLGFAHWLAALDFMLAPPQELAIVGDDPGRCSPWCGPATGRTWLWPPDHRARSAGSRCSRAGRPSTAGDGVRVPAVRLRTAGRCSRGAHSAAGPVGRRRRDPARSRRRVRRVAVVEEP